MNNAQKTVHVWVKDSAGNAHDLMICNNTELISNLKKRGMPHSYPQFYDEKKYQDLLRAAKDHLCGPSVRIETMTYIVVSIVEELMM